MTTDSIHYKTDKGVHYTLTSERENELSYYQISRSTGLPIRYNRVDLSVFTDLPWANPESLLFSALPKNQGWFGLSEAITRIKARKILGAKRILDVSELQEGYPEAFEPGINTQLKLLELIRDPDYRVWLREERGLVNTRRYSIVLMANVKLSELISLDNWTGLHALIQESPTPEKPSCSLSEWEWLYTQNIPDLCRYYNYPVPSQASTDLGDLAPSVQAKLNALSDRPMRDFMRFLLEGHPVDVALSRFD